MFQYQIDSGISSEEIIAYFLRVSTTFHKEKLIFYGDGWKVRLTMMPDAIHRSIIIPRTNIEFSGNREKCEMLIASYRKTFMRGGA